MQAEQYNKLIRIFYDGDLSVSSDVSLQEEQVHYLRNVMRKSEGDYVRLFNGKDGEFLATISELKKNRATINVVEKRHDYKSSRDLWAVQAIIKKDNFDLCVQKACEIGVAKFVPVITDNTVVHKIKQDRLQAIAIEASEQSERQDVMLVEDALKLDDLIVRNPDRIFIVCMERLETKPILDVAKAHINAPLAVIIGPEGGFSAVEADKFVKHKNVIFASLGENILRAETALIVALGAVQLSHN